MNEPRLGHYIRGIGLDTLLAMASDLGRDDESDEAQKRYEQQRNPVDFAGLGGLGGREREREREVRRSTMGGLFRLHQL